MKYQVVAPATGQVEQQYPTATDAEIGEILDRAGRGYPVWRRTAMTERADLLRRVAQLYQDRSAELGAIITLELSLLPGRPVCHSQPDDRQHDRPQARAAVPGVVPGHGTDFREAGLPADAYVNVFASNEQVALDVADRLDVGMVWINQREGGGPELPFGGTKRSGIGRELGPLGIDEFVYKKLIHTTPDGQ